MMIIYWNKLDMLSKIVFMDHQIHHICIFMKDLIMLDIMIENIYQIKIKKMYKK